MERKMLLFDRRSCIKGLAAVCSMPLASSRFVWAETDVEATLTFDFTQPLVHVPLDFTGLSYESAQLSNPAFFSASNRELVALFKGLGSQGALRLGGGTSDYTNWTGEETAAGSSRAVFGPDTSHRPKQETLTTPLAIRNLRAFLDACNWTCLYGLNMARGTTEQAAAEAAYVQRTLGHRLIAFQLGNEPDAWRSRYRPATWGYTDFFVEWKKFHAAVLARVPDARFAGPDVSHKVPWVVSFAEQAHDAIVMLTSHYYAEGPASSPNATLGKLLTPNPNLAADLQQIMAVARKYNLPYRMSEGNSCWDGGKPGVSNTLASALWCADMMLQFAQAGCCGVNLHGGGNGYYTPIAGGGPQPLVRRPEYFGMQFAEKFVRATLVPASVSSSSNRITGYAGRKDGNTLLALINKGASAARVQLPPSLSRHFASRMDAVELTGPAIDSTQGTSLTAANISTQEKGGSILMPLRPYSAIYCSLPGGPTAAHEGTRA